MFLEHACRRKFAELVADHVLGDKNGIKIFPLCTKNVCPTKSGVTIERRDQVLIGFLTPDAFILSIFSRRCDSTKGPFFNDLAHKFQVRSRLRSRLLFRSSPFQNETVARLVLRARLEAFRQLPPRTDRMMASTASFRFALAAAHRVIDRVHDHAAHMRSAALPAGPSCFAARDVHMIDVADLADGREAVLVNAADFARRHFHQRIAGFAVAKRRLLTGTARDLSATARSQSRCYEYSRPDGIALSGSEFPTSGGTSSPATTFAPT